MCIKITYFQITALVPFSNGHFFKLVVTDGEVVVPVIFYNRNNDYQKIKGGRDGALTATKFNINKEDEIVISESSDLMLRKRPHLANISEEIKAEAQRKMVAEIVSLANLPHTPQKMVSVVAIPKRVSIIPFITKT